MTLVASFWLHDIWHPLYGPGLNFWSGIGSDLGELAIIGGMITMVRHVNCHAKGCWRLGGHPVEGTPYKTCRKHHPGIPDHRVSAEHIQQAHALAGGPGPESSKLGE